MNAHVLYAGLTQVDPHTGMLRDWCLGSIIYDAEEAKARDWFQTYIEQSHAHAEVGPPQISKLTATPVLPDLLTEAGPVPIQWPQLAEEVHASLQETGEFIHELGFWVDCDQTIPPRPRATDPETLRRSLPADLVETLNWQAEKAAFFLFSALAIKAPPVIKDENLDEDGQEKLTDDDDEAMGLMTPSENPASFPELEDKELVGIVKARNALIGAWLWRRHLQGTPLAANPIRLDGWPGATPCATEPVA